MLFLIHFGQGFGKKKRHKPLDTMENLDIYSEIHLLAMPEICRFSLKTFTTVWAWKRSIQFANWLGLFVAPWFIHQKSMQDSLKHFWVPTTMYKQFVVYKCLHKGSEELNMILVGHK